MSNLNIRAAYTAHAALEVTGTLDTDTAFTITMRDLTDIPTKKDVEASIKVSGGTCRPICFPVFFEGNTSGAVPNTSSGSADLTYQASFLCCVSAPRFVMSKEKREGEDKTVLSALGPDVIDVMTAYLNALFNDSDLGGTLPAYLSATVEPGVYPWDGGDFGGFLVRQTWFLLKT